MKPIVRRGSLLPAETFPRNLSSITLDSISFSRPLLSSSLVLFFEWPRTACFLALEFLLLMVSPPERGILWVDVNHVRDVFFLSKGLSEFKQTQESFHPHFSRKGAETKLSPCPREGALGFPPTKFSEGDCLRHIVSFEGQSQEIYVQPRGLQTRNPPHPLLIARSSGTSSSDPNMQIPPFSTLCPSPDVKPPRLGLFSALRHFARGAMSFLQLALVFLSLTSGSVSSPPSEQIAIASSVRLF